MKKEQLKGNLMLLTGALIWGSAFVAQSVGLDHLGPFSFNAIRSFIGFLVLIPAALLLDRAAGKKLSLFGTSDPAARKKLLAGGALCGIVLTCASLLQQVGIGMTTVGKAGFITSLYIIMIPLWGLFYGKKVGGLVWGAVGTAMAGMYLLCVDGAFSISSGDLFVLAAAVLFSVHIMLIDRFVGGEDGVDGVRLSCIQLFVAGVISSVLMLIFEKPTASAVLGAGIPLLYAGVLSSGVAYTLQILGQKRTGPVVGSMIMSLESVFAVLSGWLLLGEELTTRELLGCALVFGAIILAQLPQKSRRTEKAAL